jgi:tRNA(fMet)-specific endonuclease VapC
MSDALALDSNAYVAYQSGDASAVRLVDTASRRILPAPVLGELYFGALNSARAAQNVALLEQFATTCELAVADAAVCLRYGRVRLSLRAAGTPIPINDLWIAAICLELDVPLLTRDAHFSHVPGLSLRSW